MDSLSLGPLPHSEQQQPEPQEATQTESCAISAFFSDQFPELSTPSHLDDIEHPIPNTIPISRRIAEALLKTDTVHSTAAVKFLVIVNLVHELGHSMHAHFHDRTQTVHFQSSRLTFYEDVGDQRIYPEAGFLLEETLFGGVVCLVFKNETDPQQLLFSAPDFTQIDRFFLIRRNGAAYRIGAYELKLHAIPVFSAVF